MNRDEVVRILKDHADEIRARGVTRLALFGSTARGAAKADSDVDVLVDLDEGRDFSLVDYAGLEVYLSEILGREVEVAQRKTLKRFVKDGILAHAIEIFPNFGRREDVPRDRPVDHRSPRQPLEDMADAIEAVERFLADRTFEDYESEQMLRQAIERNFEIISEASRRLPEDLKAKHPHIPWKQIAAIGNILRHGYRTVDNAILWNVATRELEPLKAAVESMIRDLEGAGER